MMRNRRICWLAALLLSASLVAVGCGGDETPAENNAANSTSPDVGADDTGADEDTTSENNGNNHQNHHTTPDAGADTELPDEDTGIDEDTGGEEDATDEGDTSGGATIHEVTIENNAYDPLEITIAVGDTVRWTNLDGPPLHTVTSGESHGVPSGEFNSGPIATNNTFEHTFDAAGEFSYYCVPHPSMALGKVIVED